MGLFVLPPRLTGECTPEELVDTAIANLNLWRQQNADQNYEYMIQMAMSYLNEAMAKIRPVGPANELD